MAIANNISYIFKLLLAFLYIVWAGSKDNTLYKNEKNEENLDGSGSVLSDIPISNLEKYSNAKLFSLIDMLSGFTKDVNDIQRWAEDYYSSIFYDEDVDLRVASREYIETKLSESSDWKVIEHQSLPNHKFRVRKTDSSVKLDVVTQYSGYLSYNDKNLYFYFFESRSSPLKDPLILWLNGGPGCSSLFGLFFTLGPSKYDISNDELYYNPWSWNHRSSIIFLDQPIGSGFSYSTTLQVGSSLEASWDFYVFLVLFFTAFPQYSHLDFHIAGESYAGHFIPIFASEILQYQDEPLDLSNIPVKIEKIPPINLKSVLIGNGFVDMYNQIPFYYYIGCDFSPWGRLLSKKDCESMRDHLLKCRYFLEFCNSVGSSSVVCSSAVSYCNDYLLSPFSKGKIDVYDRRLKANFTFEEQYQKFSEFVNKNKDFFNSTIEYSICNYTLTSEFYAKGEPGESVAPFISGLLETGIKVLIFAGDQDIICNWYGVDSWVHEMEWISSDEFKKLDFRLWSLKRKIGNKLKGTVAGQVKHHSGLTLLRIRDAGHSIGETQPEYNLEMYLRWLEGDYAFQD